MTSLEAPLQYVTRYVPTYVGKDGLRTIVGPAQGRYTFETYDAAKRQLDAIRQNNSGAVLEHSYGDVSKWEYQDLRLEFPDHTVSPETPGSICIWSSP